ISCFDPLRREIARLALEKLIADGRIHPARIEEVVKQSERDFDERIIELGEQAAIDVGVDSIHPELIRHLGKLHYRTSYGQNVLQHSIEVARLVSLMAVQLGLDAKLAARAGLLHDIGKAIDRNAEGTHTELGEELARRYHEPKIVLNSIAFHHDDLKSTSLIASLIQAADAISGARPGARRDSLENYIKRLTKLEEIANSFSGVSKTFALQAGREIRVMVEYNKIPDAQAEQLAHDIAQRIQDELEYPGQIKVTIIREFRAVEFAR
ncbi:MAG: HDIG domain-containing protein, partial [Candidatus Electryoneaceae bacterium]|nr:HDIG domain-containing protein [Candidatus Electryoneaceae bacterium]